MSCTDPGNALEMYAAVPDRTLTKTSFFERVVVVFAREDLRLHEWLLRPPNLTNSAINDQRGLGDVGVLFVAKTNETIDKVGSEPLGEPLRQLVDLFAFLYVLCDEYFQGLDALCHGDEQEEELFSMGAECASSPRVSNQMSWTWERASSNRCLSIRIPMKMSLSLP